LFNKIGTCKHDTGKNGTGNNGTGNNGTNAKVDENGTFLILGFKMGLGACDGSLGFEV